MVLKVRKSQPWLESKTMSHTIWNYALVELGNPRPVEHHLCGICTNHTMSTRSIFISSGNICRSFLHNHHRLDSEIGHEIKAHFIWKDKRNKERHTWSSRLAERVFMINCFGQEWQQQQLLRKWRWENCGTMLLDNAFDKTWTWH